MPLTGHGNFKLTYHRKLKYLVRRYSEKAAIEEGSHYVGLENIQSWTGRYTESEALIETDSLLFKAGDVLFGKLRPYLAKVYAAQRDGYCTSEVLVLRPHRGLLQEFLFFRLLSGDFIDRVNASTFGAKMPRADWETVGNLVIAIPSEPEQRSITCFVRRETAKIDDLIAKKQCLIELLDEKRSALISRAVTQGLDPGVPMKDSGVSWLSRVPASWTTYRLSEVARFIGGSTPSIEEPQYWDGDIPWASPKDMKLTYLSDTIDHVSQKALTKWGLSLIPPPAVLMVVRGMILVHSLPVALSRVPLTINQDMKALLVKPFCAAEFLMRWLQGAGHGLAGLIEQSAHGTRCFRSDLLKQVRCTLPPLLEQERICRHIEVESGATEETSERIAAAIDLLREYRSALITAAVTGQLDIREHEKKLEALT